MRIYFFFHSRLNIVMMDFTALMLKIAIQWSKLTGPASRIPCFSGTAEVNGRSAVLVCKSESAFNIESIDIPTIFAHPVSVLLSLLSITIRLIRSGFHLLYLQRRGQEVSGGVALLL